jgi:hypothetical protein
VTNGAEESVKGRAFILVVALTLSTGDAPAQAAPVPLRILPTADAELAHPFTHISGIRELSDGRLIVVDRGEKLVALFKAVR